MISKIMSIGLKGVEGYHVQVEVQILDGIETFLIVGLPDTSVKESKERVTSALYSFGQELIDQKIVVNLLPSEQKKNGPIFDLPIAIGILKSKGVIQSKISASTCFIGALSLDGTIHPFDGLLAAALAAKKLGFSLLYMPYDANLPDMRMDGIEIVYVSSLHEVVKHLSGQSILHLRSPEKDVGNSERSFDRDFSDIIGHSFAKRSFEVASAGEHHVFMTGPPGCGKSLLAETFPSILPPLSNESQLEKISLYQLAGMEIGVINEPPFRSPHHSASSVAIIGGGQNPKPGEISLAHRGVLFLDEMAEFPKKTLDMLRQPIETGKVTISRARSIVTYPAAFLLIGAMNPCPCGYLGSHTHYCTCTDKQIQSYQGRLSGPIRDRFDITLFLNSVKMDGNLNASIETSASIRERVQAARIRQYERYGREICNGRVSYELLLKTSPPSDRVKQLMMQMSMKKQWSNRVQVKLLRLARTISDLKEEEHLSEESLWEAMSMIQSNEHYRKERRKQIVRE
ncbi:YifB family Mg chelatase-like AAA ATPase [Robertmurraya andreesenii]|uniref:Magnesium chelatase family protein n=1 Tax=Anoxybacillus andreesenii TaxID=1325932 RepID=A0ABT9UZW9_9BACL|nr:YifB family Mg chelatase-like AAA ATPase [Robertmurraya andreesenii]MDQ0154251.1 magnesium chelatase family protein [Robertmurraya andreesenii]